MQLLKLNIEKNRKEPRISYYAILSIFIFLQLIVPILPAHYEGLFVNITFSFLILSLVFTLRFKRSLFVSAILVATLTIILNSTALLQRSFWIELLYTIAAMIFIGTITVILFKRVFFSSEGDQNPILGAICIYLMLGVIWALVYSLVDLFYIDAFQGVEFLRKFGSFIYFSFVTQTTLGYGDIVPAIPIAKNLATLQAVMGQFYLAVLVAGLLGMMIREKKS